MSPLSPSLCCFLPPPQITQTFTAALMLGGFVFIPQDPAGGSLPAPFSGSACPALWEQHPCLQGPWNQIVNPWPEGQRGQPWHGMRTGQDRGKEEQTGEQQVHLSWQVAHLYGEELREVCCAFLATRPALGTRT